MFETIAEHKLDFFAVIKTGRDNFSTPFLNNLAGGLDYAWCCMPPQGRSGGILVSFNSQTIDIKNVHPGERCVKFHLLSKCDNFEWSLVVVYGAAQDAQKGESLSELVRICENETLPLL